MDFSNMNLDSYMGGARSSSYSAEADNIKSMAGGINKDSTYEELEDAAKQFESYLLEQTIKEVKNSLDEIKGEEEEDEGYASQTRDIFLDQTIQNISSMMVNQYGQRMTKDLADQMARNMGIEIPDDGKAAVAQGESVQEAQAQNATAAGAATEAGVGSVAES